MLKHIMLDLETWGTGPFSTIIQIGACVFDPYTEMPAEIIPEAFEVSIMPRNAGLRVDADTLLWWMQEERLEARTIWLKQPKVMISEALDGFEEWVHQVTGGSAAANMRLWGNGSDFDNALLRQAYESIGAEAPWSFRHNRCFRTLRSMLTDENLQYLGTAHTALTDAKNQAIRANQIVRKLGIKLS